MPGLKVLTLFGNSIGDNIVEEDNDKVSLLDF